MDDYISRANAIQALVGITAFNSVEEIKAACFDSYARANGWLGGVMESIAALAEGIPAADVAPVVLCRDCKWFNPTNSDWCCEFENGLICPCEDDFCSFGDRREGGTDG